MISKMNTETFKEGLTVRELKKVIKDWPEEDEHGELTEVWVGTGGCLSSVITEVSPLNKRKGESGREWADIILEPTH